METVPQETRTVQSANKKTGLITGIIVLAVALGVFAYVTLFPSPESVLKRALANSAKATSMEFSAQITSRAIVPPEAGQVLPIGEGIIMLSVDGKADLRDLNNIGLEATTQWKIDSEAEDTVIALQLRLLNRVLYAELQQAPGAKRLDLSAFSGQWVKIDFDELRGVEGQDVLSDEQVKEIKRIISRSKAIQVDETLADEEIEGANTLHYRFSINKEGLLETIAQVQAVMEEKDEPHIDPGAREQIEAAEFPKGEIWIGKRDTQIRKLVISFASKRTGDTGFDGETALIFTAKSYNQPVEIQAPAGARPFQDILALMLGLPG